MKVSIEQIIENLLVLESNLGSKVKYPILDPFPVNPADIISIQEAAKKIASFIGLLDMVFIVGIAKQGEKVGGHIELSGNNREAFIELSEGVLKYPETVLSTLAHEITHKYLQLNGVRHPDENKNEILTDTASVYLGLGKIMLNGCERYTVRHEKDWQGEKTITETLTTGYLDREGLAFVYKLVCTMRKITGTQAENKLLHDSKLSLDDCQRQHRQYFDNKINNKETLICIAKDLEDDIRNLQCVLSNIEKKYIYVQKGCLIKIEEFLEKQHKDLMSLCCETNKMLEKETVNPSLAYIETIISRQELLKNKNNLINKSSEARRLEGATDRIRKKIQKSPYFPKPVPGMFNIVTCWNDMTKLRLPINACRLVAKCPKCNYQFSADTSIKSIRVSFKARIKKAIFGIGKKIRSLYQ